MATNLLRAAPVKRFCYSRIVSNILISRSAELRVKPWGIGASGLQLQSDASTAQDVHQPKEDRLMRIPGQDAIHQLAAGADDLAWQTDKRIHKGFELQPQHPTLLGLMFFLPTPRLLGQR